MAGLVERVKCRCGLGMSTTVSGAKYCENCDTVQPQEALGWPRKITRNDVRFDATWTIIIDHEYQDNRKVQGEPESNKGETKDGED